MSMFIYSKTIFTSFINFISYCVEWSLINVLFICNRHFLLCGEPILSQLYHCSPFAVVHCSFMGRRFAVAATSARE